MKWVAFIVFTGFGQLCLASGGINPPALLFDADNNGVVDGWTDLFEVYYDIGTTDLDSDVDLDGDVDWDDVVALDNHVVLYDTTGDWLITSADATAIINHLNAGGGFDANFDINQDGFVSAIDALWIINSLAASPWKNASNSFDVSGDGFVSAIDALRIINFINANGAGPLAGRADKCRPNFYDVNGDLAITTADADAVIAFLSLP